MMSKGFVVPEEMPSCCAECPFHTEYEEWSVEPGLYKKIARCIFAPEENEDPYRDILWMLDHKEEWCPLIPIEYNKIAKEKSE